MIQKMFSLDRAKTQWTYEDVFSITLSMVFFSFFFTKLCNAIIILNVVIWLSRIRYNSEAFQNVKNYVYLFVLYYGIHIVGLIHSNNFTEGMNRLEAKLPLLVFPIIVLCNHLKREHVERILYFYCGSAIIISLYLMQIFVYKLVIEGIHPVNLIYLWFVEPIGAHPTYYSLFISVAIFFLYSKRNDTVFNSTLKKSILYFAILFLIAVNLMLISRATLVAFFLVVVAYVIVKLFKSGSRKVIFASIIVFIFCAFVLTLFPWIFERFELFFTVDDPLSQKSIDSVSLHIKSWYCSVEALKNYHLFTGYGTGDERDVLVSCYSARAWQLMVETRLTAHNEYLSSLLRHGIPGLVITMAMLILPAYSALRRHDFVYFSFLFLIAFVLLSGSLNLYHGVIFYSLTNAVLARRMITSNT